MKSCFVVTAKGFFHGKRVQELEKELVAEIRAELIMALLASLWYIDPMQAKSGTCRICFSREDGKSTRTELDRVFLTLNSTDRHVQLIAKDLRELVTPYSTESPRKQRVLVQHLWDANWHPTSTTLPPHLETSIGDEIVKEGIRSRIISSLSFDTLNNRESMIQPAYAKKFTWIFPNTDEERNRAAPWIHISTWLESQHMARPLFVSADPDLRYEWIPMGTWSASICTPWQFRLR
jgi:hypothetical protein